VYEGGRADFTVRSTLGQLFDGSYVFDPNDTNISLFYSFCICKGVRKITVIIYILPSNQWLKLRALRHTLCNTNTNVFTNKLEIISLLLFIGVDVQFKTFVFNCSKTVRWNRNLQESKDFQNGIKFVVFQHITRVNFYKRITLKTQI